MARRVRRTIVATARCFRDCARHKRTNPVILDGRSGGFGGNGVPGGESGMGLKNERDRFE